MFRPARACFLAKLIFKSRRTLENHLEVVHALRYAFARGKREQPLFGGRINMEKHLQFYIDGKWVGAESGKSLDVIDPASEQAIAQIAAADHKDVDKAVAAARRAFESYSRSSKQERIELLERIIRCYEARQEELAQLVSKEMGALIGFSRSQQVTSGLGHFQQTLETLRAYDFEEDHGSTRWAHEPIGVCAMITPWNWPLNQIAAKVAPALAAGCTMVLKPSEIAPLDAIAFAEIIDEAGVPDGVFNLVNGTGPEVGEYMAGHPGVDMVSFTGSTRAGILVAKAAAGTIKRVTQELGGKSPNILLDDVDLETAVRDGVLGCFGNAGQSCDAPSRMFVPAARYEEAVEIARETAAQVSNRDPFASDAAETDIGPVVSQRQYEKIQGLLQKGVTEGARLVIGGPGRAEGFDKGYYVRPTVFADVNNEMTIAREEIFGPALAMIPYESEEEAVELANDTPYGLAGYVSSGDLDRARQVAAKIRAGNVYINGAPPDGSAPFGGYKQSGNGREFGKLGLEEYLEVKAIAGYGQ